MSRPSRFIELCELAKCSPDFAAVHELCSMNEQVDWMYERLVRFVGVSPGSRAIADAIQADKERPAVAEHVVRLRSVNPA